MDHKADWGNVLTRIRSAASLAVTQFEIGGDVTDDDLEVIKLLHKTLPPPAIANFLMGSNGVKLLWSGTLVGESVQGSINILPLVQSCLRAPEQEGGEPLEDVLWNDEFAPEVLQKLKRMAIFESIAGKSAYLTYYADEADGRLLLIEDDHIRPIVPDFETTVQLLKTYAGADSLRYHLTQTDWRDRIGKDRILQRIAAL